jgi:hypothetical protein
MRFSWCQRHRKSVHHVPEHLSTMSPVHTLAQKKVTKEEGLKSHVTAHLRQGVLLMAAR